MSDVVIMGAPHRLQLRVDGRVLGEWWVRDDEVVVLKPWFFDRMILARTVYAKPEDARWFFDGVEVAE